jgi:preprotein translocase subunit SecE
VHTPEYSRRARRDAHDPNSMSKIQAYLEDVGKEMRKVSWPTRAELVSNTVITLVATVLISAFIFGADRIISLTLEVIYG